MNLTLDIGNTRSKTAIFDGDKLLDTHDLNREQVESSLEAYLELHPEIHNIIYSTVGPKLSEFNTSLFGGILLRLEHSTRLPLKNKYETKETLGTDRISNAVGAAHLFPGRNVLVIDAGTCITLDMVDQEGNYHGGSISNGLQMRFQALNTFTENLPLIAHNEAEIPNLIGKSTSDSIKSGVINGLVAELCGMIDQYNALFDSVQLVLTGGDSAYLELGLHNRIDIKKNEIFANPNLVHVGLNAILNYNVKSE